MKAKRALLIVDMQNDFCPGGALGVPEGHKIIPNLNKYIRFFAKKKLPIFASRDWHPVRTKHFRDFGGTWPLHCVQNTKGAAFHPDLKLPKIAVQLYKGMDPDKDSYSAFQAHDFKGMDFSSLLKLMGINELNVGGLATDYCVKSSALDALKKKFKVRLLMDAIKGVNLKPNDSDKAIKGMIRKGAKKAALKNLRQ